MQNPKLVPRRPPPLVRTAGLLLEEVSKDLEPGQPDRSVHGARRRIKRLRSLAQLLRRAIGKSAYGLADGYLKIAADALAGQRRAEALQAAVVKLKTDAGAARELREMITDSFRPPDDPDRALAVARTALAAVAAALASWRLPADHQTLAARAFAKTYGKARRGLRAGLASGKAEALHEARKLVIHHLHHLELLGETLTPARVARAAALEDLREVLGDLNDLAELRHVVHACRQHSGTALRKAISRRRNRLLKRAKSYYRPLFDEKTGAFVERIGAMRGQGAA